MIVFNSTTDPDLGFAKEQTNSQIITMNWRMRLFSDSLLTDVLNLQSFSCTLVANGDGIGHTDGETL
jgi:hypothetical protein